MTNSSLPEPDLPRAFELVMQLMAIPGKSGDERLVADAIVDLLRKAGVQDDWIAFDNAHQRALIPGNVGNLIVKLPGTQRGPRRLLTAHMDTVPICVGAQPVRQGEFVLSG